MNDSRQEAPTVNPPKTHSKNKLRKQLRVPLMAAGIIVVIATAGYVYLTSGRYESTDDAYVQSATVSISADVSGRVNRIAVHDNQQVHKGEVLFTLDDSKYRIAVDQAKAQLAAARMKVKMLKAGYRQRVADLTAAKANLKFAQAQYQRQRRLATRGLTTQAQLDQASHHLADARSQLDAVQQALNASLASLAGNPDIAPSQHPDVQQAQAALDRAQLNLQDTVITAPSNGVVTRVDALQVGNYIEAAQAVFALVSNHDVWIQANFKENQLTHMHPGQTATVKIDSYPGKTFVGKLVSLSPGTGAQFSVLPPENATGNWVKVVQRLPVRIKLNHLDPNYPLMAGLSASVSVDTRSSQHVYKHADNSQHNGNGNKA